MLRSLDWAASLVDTAAGLETVAGGRGSPTWLFADDGDVTYIGSHDRSGRTYWRAVHPDDSLEAVPLPPDFELKAVSDGVFYGVVADEFDVQRVVGVRVER